MVAAGLSVTYFGGDELKAPGVPSDEETKRIWLKRAAASRGSPKTRFVEAARTARAHLLTHARID